MALEEGRNTNIGAVLRELSSFYGITSAVMVIDISWEIAHLQALRFYNGLLYLSMQSRDV